MSEHGGRQALVVGGMLPNKTSCGGSATPVGAFATKDGTERVSNGTGFIIGSLDTSSNFRYVRKSTLLELHVFVDWI